MTLAAGARPLASTAPAAAACVAMAVALSAGARRAQRCGRAPRQGRDSRSGQVVLGSLALDSAGGTAAGAALAERRRAKAVGSGPEYNEAHNSLLEQVLSRASATVENSMLRGNFGPVSRELSADRLDVLEGAIPADFPHGTYVRNGPNPYFEPVCRDEPVLGRTGHHWFEGDGMLHAVTFGCADNAGTMTASYKNRWVRTASLQRELEAQHIMYRGTIDSDPAATIVNSVLNSIADGGWAFRRAANTALVHHAGKLLALHEGSPPVSIALPGLETLGEHVFEGESVPCPHRSKREFGAHPKVDPESGEMVFFGRSPVKPFLTVGVVGPDGALKHLVPLEGLQYCTVMHDWAITPRFTIVLDLPFVIAPENLAEGRPLIEWQGDEKPTRIGMMPRFGREGDIQWFDVEPGYIFHTVNAHEEGDVVVLRACRSSGISLSPQTTFGEGWAEQLWKPGSMYHSFLHEWRFDLSTGSVLERDLSGLDHWCEFPVINPRFLGRAHQFAYCVDHNLEESTAVEAPLVRGWLKYSLADGAWTRHDLGPWRWGGEAAFVPRGDGAEDDGWLVSFVFDEKADRSEVVIVDCKDFSAPPVCRLALPGRVPFGFHGIFVAGEA